MMPRLDDPDGGVGGIVGVITAVGGDGDGEAHGTGNGFGRIRATGSDDSVVGGLR